MPINWNRLADQHETYTAADFQRAAMRLITEQVLYQANNKQRSDYDLVAAYENEFGEAIGLFGCKLDHNSRERYVASVPTQPVGRIPLLHTLLALVLRKLYDHHMNRGSLSGGIAGVGLPELETAYKESTGRELPMRPQSDLQGLLEAMRRWGIARLVKFDAGGGEPDWNVEILPGIQSLISERSLANLKAHAEQLYETGHSEPLITEDDSE